MVEHRAQEALARGQAPLGGVELVPHALEAGREAAHLVTARGGQRGGEVAGRQPPGGAQQHPQRFEDVPGQHRGQAEGRQQQQGDQAGQEEGHAAALVAVVALAVGEIDRQHRGQGAPLQPAAGATGEGRQGQAAGEAQARGAGLQARLPRMGREPGHDVRRRQDRAAAGEDPAGVAGLEDLAVQTQGEFAAHHVGQAGQELGVHLLAVEEGAGGRFAIEHRGEVDGDEHAQVQGVRLPDHHQRRLAGGLQEGGGLAAGQVAEGLVQEQLAIGPEDHALAHGIRSERAFAGQATGEHLADVLAAGQGAGLLGEQAAELTEGGDQAVAGTLARLAIDALEGLAVGQAARHHQQDHADGQVAQQEAALEAGQPAPATPHQPPAGQAHRQQDHVQQQEAAEVQQHGHRPTPLQTEEESLPGRRGHRRRQGGPAAEPLGVAHVDHGPLPLARAQGVHGRGISRVRQIAEPRVEPALMIATQQQQRAIHLQARPVAAAGAEVLAAGQPLGQGGDAQGLDGQLQPQPARRVAAGDLAAQDALPAGGVAAGLVLQGHARPRVGVGVGVGVGVRSAEGPPGAAVDDLVGHVAQVAGGEQAGGPALAVEDLHQAGQAQVAHGRAAPEPVGGHVALQGATPAASGGRVGRAGVGGRHLRQHVLQQVADPLVLGLDDLVGLAAQPVALGLVVGAGQDAVVGEHQQQDPRRQPEWSGRRRARPGQRSGQTPAEQEQQRAGSEGEQQDHRVQGPEGPGGQRHLQADEPGVGIGGHLGPESGQPHRHHGRRGDQQQEAATRCGRRRVAGARGGPRGDGPPVLATPQPGHGAGHEHGGDQGVGARGEPAPGEGGGEVGGVQEAGRFVGSRRQLAGGDGRGQPAEDVQAGPETPGQPGRQPEAARPGGPRGPEHQPQAQPHRAPEGERGARPILLEASRGDLDGQAQARPDAIGVRRAEHDVLHQAQAALGIAPAPHPGGPPVVDHRAGDRPAVRSWRCVGTRDAGQPELVFQAQIRVAGRGDHLAQDPPAVVMDQLANALARRSRSGHHRAGPAQALVAGPQRQGQGSRVARAAMIALPAPDPGAAEGEGVGPAERIGRHHGDRAGEQLLEPRLAGTVPGRGRGQLLPGPVLLRLHPLGVAETTRQVGAHLQDQQQGEDRQQRQPELASDRGAAGQDGRQDGGHRQQRTDRPARCRRAGRGAVHEHQRDQQQQADQRRQPACERARHQARSFRRISRHGGSGSR